MPRVKRIGPSRKRAEAYLAAVCAANPDERYGDKVDKPWCCAGSYGDGYTEPIEPCPRGCEGRTWREKWMEKFGQLDWDGEPVLKPLVWAKIERRPTNPWEEFKAVTYETWPFGTVIQIKADYITRVGGVAKVSKERRLMVIDSNRQLGLIVRSEKPAEIGTEQRYGLDVWEAIDE